MKKRAKKLKEGRPIEGRKSVVVSLSMPAEVREKLLLIPRNNRSRFVCDLIRKAENLGEYINYPG